MPTSRVKMPAPKPTFTAQGRFGISERPGQGFIGVPDIQSVPVPSLLEEQPVELPAGESDAAYAHMIAQREALEGLPQPESIPEPIPNFRPFLRREPEPPRQTQRRQFDFQALPDQFVLNVERKGDSWKITSPAHIGLWKAGHDLPVVVQDALAALAEMIALDGPVPRPAMRKRKVKP